MDDYFNLYPQIAKYPNHKAKIYGTQFFFSMVYVPVAEELFRKLELSKHCGNYIKAHNLLGVRGSVVGFRRYATSRKVAGSSPDEVVLQQPYYGPRVDSASNRNKYQKSSWGIKRPARRADNLAAICVPNV
jgi:hypothetical protein